MRLRFLAGVLAGMIGCLVLWPGGGQATTPPLAPLAEVVFENGGRIVSIKADGSGRKVLTRKGTDLLRRNYLADIHYFGDSQPAISPDGGKLAFVRYRPAAHSQQVMLADRDGWGATAVKGINAEIQSLDFMPDGRLLLTTWDYRYGYSRTTETFRILALDPATGKKKVLVSKRFFGNYNDDTLQAQEVSPDGKSLLYTRDFGENDDGHDVVQLRIRNLVSGAERVLVTGAEAGSFSPDGERVAFTKMCVDTEGYAHCAHSGDGRTGVWTIGVDGSDRQLIVTGDGGYSSPDWGPGGGYIIFASSRNFPEERQDANEIYSVRSDGECLTWLTNGSPESIMPAWAPETEVRTDPGAKCGAAGRKPLAEARPPRAIDTDPSPRYWAGPIVANRLLSKVDGYAQDEFGSPIYRYGDCPFFDSSDCRRPITIEIAFACGGLGEVRVPPRGREQVIRRRGVRVTRHWTARGKFVTTTLRTGLVDIGIGQSMLDVEDIGGRASTFSDHLAFIDNLRPVGKPLVPGSKLPPAAMVKCQGRR